MVVIVMVVEATSEGRTLRASLAAEEVWAAARAAVEVVIVVCGGVDVVDVIIRAALEEDDEGDLRHECVGESSRFERTSTGWAREFAESVSLVIIDTERPPTCG